MSKSVKIIIIVTGLVVSLGIITGIIYFSSFGKVKITTTPESASISIDGNKEETSPLAQTLRTGKHKAALSKEGYITNTFDFNVKSGKNEFYFELIAARYKFIQGLPISTDKWNIYYNDLNDSILVVINQAPYDKTLNEAKDWLKTQGINTEKDNVRFSGVVGVQPGAPELPPF